MMRHWKTIAKVAVAVLTALLGALGSAAAGVLRSEPKMDEDVSKWAHPLFFLCQNATLIEL